ncbi:hypothetical protein PIB30_034454 [Stylosanthes scabra]|uniref:Uncharacterized protein n=1 Tax=Stylosanthes scabra TaxID=79078 RepID=A0ABU6TEY0_9FABA|nr:hypothetical protein [Stylosanthes scabra]
MSPPSFSPSFISSSRDRAPFSRHRNRVKDVASPENKTQDQYDETVLTFGAFVESLSWRKELNLTTGMNSLSMMESAAATNGPFQLGNFGTVEAHRRRKDWRRSEHASSSARNLPEHKLHKKQPNLNHQQSKKLQEKSHRPPQKPPNFALDGGDELRSLAHEIDGTTLGDSDEGLTASSGTEDGAVVKGKVETEVITSSTARTREPVRVEAGNGGVVTETWWCSSREDDDAAYQSRSDCASKVAGGATCNAENSVHDRRRRGSVDRNSLELRQWTQRPSSSSIHREAANSHGYCASLESRKGVANFEEGDMVLLGEARGERRGGRRALWLPTACAMVRCRSTATLSSTLGPVTKGGARHLEPVVVVREKQRHQRAERRKGRRRSNAICHHLGSLIAAARPHVEGMKGYTAAAHGGRERMLYGLLWFARRRMK